MRTPTLRKSRRHAMIGICIGTNIEEAGTCSAATANFIGRGTIRSTRADEDSRQVIALVQLMYPASVAVRNWRSMLQLQYPGPVACEGGGK